LDRELPSDNPGVSMSDSSAIRIIHPREFDKGTLQTPGSERQAAVAPQLGVESTMWGGMFEVKPGAVREFTTMASSRPSHMCCPAYAKCAGVRMANAALAPRRAISFTRRHSFRTWRSIRQIRNRSDGVVVRSTSTPIVVNLPEDTWRSFPDARNVAAG
jgi:hypothetical protein